MDIGTNVSAEMDGDTLVLRIDTSKNYGPSSTGKSVKVASTNGNVPVEGANGAILGLNLYRKIGG